MSPVKKAISPHPCLPCSPEVQDGTGHVVAEHGIQSPIIFGEVLVETNQGGDEGDPTKTRESNCIDYYYHYQ